MLGFCPVFLNYVREGGKKQKPSQHLFSHQGWEFIPETFFILDQRAFRHEEKNPSFAPWSPLHSADKTVTNVLIRTSRNWSFSLADAKAQCPEGLPRRASQVTVLAALFPPAPPSGPCKQRLVTGTATNQTFFSLTSSSLDHLRGKDPPC